MEVIESNNRFDDSPPVSPKRERTTKFESPIHTPAAEEDQGLPPDVVVTPTTERPRPNFVAFGQRLHAGVSGLPVVSTVWAAAKPELVTALDVYLDNPTESEALIVSFTFQTAVVHWSCLNGSTKEVAENLLIQKRYQRAANLSVERFLYGILQVSPRDVRPADIEGLSGRLTEMAKHSQCLKRGDPSGVLFRRLSSKLFSIANINNSDQP